MSKPRIVVSRCLGYEACRYNGDIIESSWRKYLDDHADVIMVCPEVLAGLGVPREPINLFRIDGKVHVIQEETLEDVTERLENVSEEFLSTIGKVDGFVLKSKSPSCGLGTTTIHFGESIYIASGVFAKKAMDMHRTSLFIDDSTLEEEGVEQFIEKF